MYFTVLYLKYPLLLPTSEYKDSGIKLFVVAVVSVISYIKIAKMIIIGVCIKQLALMNKAIRLYKSLICRIKK